MSQVLSVDPSSIINILYLSFSVLDRILINGILIYIQQQGLFVTYVIRIVVII